MQRSCGLPRSSTDVFGGDGQTRSHTITHTSEQSPTTDRVAGQTRSVTASVTTGRQFLSALSATATVARVLLSAVPDAAV